MDMGVGLSTMQMECKEKGQDKQVGRETQLAGQ